MSLRTFTVHFREGDASVQLAPELEQREVIEPGGQTQVQHRVAFRAIHSNGQREHWLVFTKSTLDDTRAEYGIWVLDNEEILRRLFARRFESSSSSLEELPVRRQDVEEVLRSGVEISVYGARTNSADWAAVRDLPRDRLPELTPGQKEVARKFKIPEEDYARSALAEQHGMQRLLAKAHRFARLLQEKIGAIEPAARIQRVRLDTLQGEFEVEVAADGTSVPLEIAEDLVDDLFKRGSEDAEKRLSRILDLALRTRAV